MNKEVEAFNDSQTDDERVICQTLSSILYDHFSDADCKIWHRHPVWFLNDNPIVGYNILKAGIRLMFWSGVDFEEDLLAPGTGKLKDASILYTTADDINIDDIKRWIQKGRNIQWDYKNIYKNKGKLYRIL